MSIDTTVIPRNASAADLADNTTTEAVGGKLIVADHYQITIAELTIGVIFVEASAGMIWTALQADAFTTAAGKESSIDTTATTAAFSADSYLGTIAAETVALGEALGSTTVDTGAAGEQITTTSAPHPIASVLKPVVCTATRCRITASNKTTVLGTATFIGNVATFATAVILSPSTVYYVLLDASGGAYTRAFTTGVSYPKTGGAAFNYTDHSSNGSGYADGVVSITTNTPAVSGGYVQTVALPVLDGTNQYVYVHPWQNAGDAVTFDLDYDGDGTYEITAQPVDTFIDLGTGGVAFSNAKFRLNCAASTVFKGYAALVD